MTFPPLFERELRAGARKAGFFWMRTMLALVAAWLGYQILSLNGAWTNMPTVLGKTLLRQETTLLFVTALLMGLFAADCISRERREGTLSLLLLTGLEPAQIIYGKLLSRGLVSLLALMSSLPGLMISVLLGGVTGEQVAMTGLGLLNILFVALAATLWVSARLRERAEVFVMAAALLGGLAIGPQVLLTALLRADYQGVPAFLSLLGGMSPSYGFGGSWVAYILWFLWMQAVGWFFLHRAADALAANWRDEPQTLAGLRGWPIKQREEQTTEDRNQRTEIRGQRTEDREQRTEDGDQGSVISGLPRRSTAEVGQLSVVSSQWSVVSNESLVTSAATLVAPASERIFAVEGEENEHEWGEGPRPWDPDPIRWRMERIGLPHAPILIAVTVAFFGHFISIENASTGAAAVWGFVFTLAAGAVLAWAGARLFQDTHRLQDLELLLTTPQGGRNILVGQWNILRRALLWPVVIALAVALPSAITVINSLLAEHGQKVAYFLPTLLTPFNLVIEVIALCWMGMWFGLRSRTLISAVAWTIGVVQIVPTIAVMLLMWAGPLAAARFGAPAIPILLFFLFKNAALIFWARARLRRELRL